MLSASPNCSLFRLNDVVDEVAVPLTSYSSVTYIKEELTLNVPILMITTPDEEGAVMTYLNDDYVYDDEFDFVDSESDSDSDNNVFSEIDSDTDRDSECDEDSLDINSIVDKFFNSYEADIEEEDSVDMNFIVDQFFNSSEADIEEEDEDEFAPILDQFPVLPKNESADDSLSLDAILDQFPAALNTRLLDEEFGDSLMVSKGWTAFTESLGAESKATGYRKSKKGGAQVKREDPRMFKCNAGESWWKTEVKSEKARTSKCNEDEAWWKV
ncbi:hypothetical protein E1B28_002643 [Marasmius oreades]|uniref:Uncharacterized protein n=1 Tax=Marasmius oreades TaxID=181124 RepID=A0A9P7RNS8_9AGAR|nr:uncharacterized protein E1B28_002643 [Marasmius oreades]KAG7086707.1 hypothetical protein E1B28_002643 [Marasmius oreades]